VSVLTAAGVREHLGIPALSQVTDAALQGFIDAAEDAIADRVGPLTPTAVTEVAIASAGYLSLNRGPFISLTSATHLYDATVTITNADVVCEPGNVLTLPLKPLMSGPWHVVYQAGWNPMPSRFYKGTAELIRHMWETQRAGRNASADLGALAHSLTYRVEEMIEDKYDAGFA
jgi:hypothetical protein